MSFSGQLRGLPELLGCATYYQINSHHPGEFLGNKKEYARLNWPIKTMIFFQVCRVALRRVKCLSLLEVRQQAFPGPPFITS
jgi:hypothetical protein